MDVEINQLLCEIADKFENCVILIETFKKKFCNKTNPLNENKNDFDDDGLGPADRVSLIAARCMSVTSSKFFKGRQIELERKRSDLQILEDLARSRKSKTEAAAEGLRLSCIWK